MTNQPSPDMRLLAGELILAADGIWHVGVVQEETDHMRNVAEVMRRAAVALSQPVSHSPDMGQSVSDAQVEAAARAIADAMSMSAWPDREWGMIWADKERRHSYETYARAATQAAERLRAPVGGDGKSDREILADEAAKTSKLEAEAIREGNFSYVPALWRWEVALAAMARVRCAIPDGWRLIPVEATDEMLDGMATQIVLCDPSFFTGRDLAWEAYHVMLEVAPTLPIAKGDER